MDVPEGVASCVKGISKLLCLLKKSLYGLKQASHNWNKKFIRLLNRLGFKANPADACLFLLLLMVNIFKMYFF